jgi:hypothetical protein
LGRRKHFAVLCIFREADDPETHHVIGPSAANFPSIGCRAIHAAAPTGNRLKPDAIQLDYFEMD